LPESLQRSRIVDSGRSVCGAGGTSGVPLPTYFGVIAVGDTGDGIGCGTEGGATVATAA
jgi:hypothetical protein